MTDTPELSVRLIKEPVDLTELAELAEAFGDLVKAVVDIEQRLMAIGGELHADEEQFLLERGSEQVNLWGINLYPDQYGTDGWIEYDSMINVRPRQQNRSRSVESAEIRQVIVAIVAALVKTDD